MERDLTDLNEIIKLKEDDKSLSFKERVMMQRMFKIGTFSDGKYSVYVNWYDGHVPYFHVVDSETNGKLFHSWISIKSNRFLCYDECDILDRKEQKELDDFLRQSHRSNTDWTNWQCLLDSWNVGNDECLIDEDMEQPDYTNIKTISALCNI